LSERTADAMPTDTPDAVRVPTPEPARRSKGGAPKGNVNGARDPRFTLAMRKAQALARRVAGKLRRSAESEARAVVAECGLADSPLAGRLARRLASADHEIATLRRVVNRVGRVKRTGALTPAYERLVSLERDDRVELRSLIDRLGEIRANSGAMVGELAKLLTSSFERERATASVAPSPAAFAPSIDAATVTEPPTLADDPRSVAARADADAWTGDDDPGESFDAPDDFAKPDPPFAAEPVPPRVKSAETVQPVAPTPTRPSFRPGVDGPRTSGRWTPLDGREHGGDDFDD